MARTPPVDLAMLAVALLAQAPSNASSIVGTWRGSSTCADPAHDTACRDEAVIYEVDSTHAAAGSVHMRAGKVVNGARQEMGTFDLRYDQTHHAWVAELSMRLHILWSFQPQGDQLTGTLTELPSGRLIRRVAARR